MRLSVAIVAFCLFIVGFSAANDVHAAIRKQTNIPAGGLGPALETLAKARDFHVVYVSEDISALETHGAVGELTVEEALKRLLGGTGFTYRFYGDNAVSIVPIGSPLASRSDGSSQTEMQAPIDPARQDSTLERLRLAQLDQGSSASPAAVTPTPQDSNLSADSSAQLAEIIVTAQKRAERIQDVPVPVTVLSAEALVNNNQLRVQDYYATIPGLSVSPQSEGSFQILSIRGITTGGYQNPTVGPHGRRGAVRRFYVDRNGGRWANCGGRARRQKYDWMVRNLVVARSLSRLFALNGESQTSDMGMGPEEYKEVNARCMLPLRPRSSRKMSSASAGDAALAGQLAALGAPAFACTPDRFQDLMAAAMGRRSIAPA